MRVAFFLLFAWLATLAWASSPRVLGELGQAVEAGTLHSAMSTSSRSIYRVRPYEYLIVRRTRSDAWVQVMLQNGRLAYMQSRRVAILPYQVTAKDVPAPSRSGGVAAQLANYALNYTGTPYVWGGNSLTRGVDCSAFVQQLFGKIGVDLPRTAAQQALVGQRIERLEDLRPGDRLYFWEKRRNKIGHTGIYLGNGHFVHSSRGRRGVATDLLAAPQWLNTLVAARR
jgi:cell wall-associated NlpC family hydrolase